MRAVTKHVVVIGAGIVGVSTAIWLLRAGADVTIIDRLAPGKGTSHGNAGVLAAAAMVPVTTPGLIKKAPRMVLSPDFPLFLRWLYLPKIAPWLVGYLSNANDTDTRRIARNLAPIVTDSVTQHKSLVSELGLENWITESDYCFAYKDQAAFDGDRYAWGLRKEMGFEPQMIRSGDVHDYEPNISQEIGLIAALKEHGFIRDPGGYVQSLAQAFEGMGGKIVQADVKDFDLSGGHISGLDTSAGRIDCDDAVLATGVWSKPLMKKLGLNVPLESERGYHIVYENATGGPSRPTMIAAGKFVATPMEQGVRCAGLVELGGLDAGPSQAPLNFLRKNASAMFPNMKATSEIEWLGHRPATTDSLPLIGQIGTSGVYTAFGHQHIGLTGGPKTGRLVAGLVMDQPANIDLSVYAPQRFQP